jgi:hypothetical protein
MAGKVMAEGAGRVARLLRWCGIALVAAGGLMVVATLLHPSRETASTIVASLAGRASSWLWALPLICLVSG